METDPLFQSGQIVGERFVMFRSLVRNDTRFGVFHVWDKKLRTDAVLKFSLSERGDALDREKTIGERIDHARLLRQLDHGQFRYHNTNFSYVLIEYLELGDLGTVPPPSDCPIECVRAALDAAEALKYLHSLGILHRDVKPNNFFWTSHWRVKLGDFDVSKDLSLLSESVDTRANVGARAYRPPELLEYDRIRSKNSKKASAFLEQITDPAIDVWALGASLFTFLTSRFPRDPSDGIHPVAALEHVGNLASVVGWTTEERERIPDKLRDLVEHMLSDDPRGRPCIDFVIDRLREYSPATPQAHFEFRLWSEDIRHALRNKIAGAVHSLVEKIGKAVKWWETKAGAERLLYATVLLRSADLSGKPEGANKPTPSLGEELFSIYIGAFDADQLEAVDDWQENVALRTKPTSIWHCCSGLPILLLDRRLERIWSGKGLINNDFVEVKLGKKKRDVSHIVLTGVAEACGLRETRSGIPPEKGRLIRQLYAWDRELDVNEGGREFVGCQWVGETVGWNMKQVNSRQKHKMRPTAVEIVAPLYHPRIWDHKSATATKDDILGIINLEWVGALKKAQIDAITKVLTKHVHEDRLLGLGPFTSEILGILAKHETRPPGPDDGLILGSAEVEKQAHLPRSKTSASTELINP